MIISDEAFRNNVYIIFSNTKIITLLKKKKIILFPNQTEEFRV